MLKRLTSGSQWSTLQTTKKGSNYHILLRLKTGYVTRSYILIWENKWVQPSKNNYTYFQGFPSRVCHRDNLLTITQDQNRTKECNDQNLIIPISRIFFSIVHVRQLTNYKPRIRTPLNEHDDLFMLGCTPQNTLDEYTHKSNEH